ncbi:hypothetical protein [Sorangium sp. So ce426]|uniref:hypothetical protein n=1 Tax=Sorangium sp. So ce426 TaxID=3133312 RepID=UPI003F5C822B
MRTTSKTTQSTKMVSQGQRRHGTAEPQIELGLSKGTSHSLVTAALNKLDAAVELTTPECDRWIVHTASVYDARGYVYLELADVTRAEAERGMAMLKKLVG